MADDEPETRGRLLDVAQNLILQHGFGATSVAMIVERAGVTKGSFFYHFDSKSELAHALIKRYSTLELDLLHDTMRRAESLASDPKQQLLVFLNLLIESFGPDQEPPEGCLFASYCYEANLFDDEILSITRRTLEAWGEVLSDKLERVAEEHPPRREVDLDTLADSLMTVFEGGFVMSRTFERKEILVQQLRHLHHYFDLLFADDASPRSHPTETAPGN